MLMTKTNKSKSYEGHTKTYFLKTYNSWVRIFGTSSFEKSAFRKAFLSFCLACLYIQQWPYATPSSGSKTHNLTSVVLDVLCTAVVTRVMRLLGSVHYRMWLVYVCKKQRLLGTMKDHIYGLVQNCSYTSAWAMELLQFCTKPSTYRTWMTCNTNSITKGIISVRVIITNTT